MEEFGPISFADYKHDMDELGTSAATAVAKLVARNAELTYQLWLVVKAAGGAVTVYDSDLARHSPNDCKLKWWRNEADASVVIETMHTKD